MLTALEEYNAHACDYLILSGIPHWKSQDNALNERIQNKVTLEKTYHFCTFGDAHNASTAEEGRIGDDFTPVEEVYNLLLTLIAKASEATGIIDLEKDFEQANCAVPFLVGAYNRGDNYHFKAGDNEVSSLDLADYGNFAKFDLEVYAENLKRRPDSYYDFVKDMAQYSIVLPTLRKNRNQYLKRKIAQAKIEVINGTAVAFVYADDHINEIAGTLLNFLEGKGYEKAISFVGRHTRGDDMFSIRSRHVACDRVAVLLNKGKGKPSAAQVFLGDATDSTYQALLKALLEIL